MRRFSLQAPALRWCDFAQRVDHTARHRQEGTCTDERQETSKAEFLIDPTGDRENVAGNDRRVLNSIDARQRSGVGFIPARRGHTTSRTDCAMAEGSSLRVQGQPLKATCAHPGCGFIPARICAAADTRAGATPGPAQAPFWGRQVPSRWPSPASVNSWRPDRDWSGSRDTATASSLATRNRRELESVTVPTKRLVLRRCAPGGPGTCSEGGGTMSDDMGTGLLPVPNQSAIPHR